MKSGFFIDFFELNCESFSNNIFNMKQLNKVFLFIVITFAISFSYVLLYLNIVPDRSNRLIYTLFAASYMFIPMLSTIIIEKGIYKNRLKDLFISFKINKWFFVAWLLSPVVVFANIGVSLLFPELSFSYEMAGFFERFEAIMSPEEILEVKASMKVAPSALIVITLFQGLIAGISINAVAGFGEELGWRGFLLKELKNSSFIKASLIIGVVWGIWHFPLILLGHNYPLHPQIGVLMMVVFCVLMTPIFIYVTIKSGSVIAAAIMHGTLNAVAGLSIMFIEGGNDLIVGLPGLTGFITIVIFTLLFFIYDFYITKEKIFLKKIGDSLK